MGSVEEGLRAQVRNIEATYGRPMSAWIELIRASGKGKHAEIMAMLKADHGLTHGSANRVALIARDALAASTPLADGMDDPVAQLYSGKRAATRPIHDELMTTVSAFGTDVEVAPKKGYLSLRRKKQFAMIQPAADHVDVGLILKGVPTTDRLRSAATFNAMFTHRVRVDGVTDVNAELVNLLKQAYDQAG